MGILIKDQPMPKDCFECIALTYIEFKGKTDWYCLAVNELLKVNAYMETGKRPPECPMTEAPTPRTGRWEQNPHWREYDVCSVCGVGVKRREYGINPDGEECIEMEYSYQFCPYCGAKMDLSTAED